MGSRIRRHVRVSENPRNEEAPPARLPVARVTNKIPSPCIPTGDPRHTFAIREGRISFEIFSKKRLAQIPVDPDVERDLKLGRGEEVDNAAQKLREGREESAERNAAKVRKQGRKKSVLRKGEQVRPSRKERDKKGEQHVQKRRKTETKAKEPEKVTKLKKKFVKKRVKSEGGK